jgi:plastocyanin
MTMEHQPCADGALMVSMIQTPVPVTPAATTAAPPPATPAAPPPPTPTLLPAPKENRVGALQNYPKDWTLMYVHDRGTNAQVRVICGNSVAISGKVGEPFPYGSILVMETWNAKAGSAPGTLALDDKGHFIRENLVSLHVMRKEKGFGADYKQFQAGEWEFVGYRPDGSILNAPEATGFCADCHSAALTEKTDWTFRALQFYDHLNTQILPAPMQKVQLVVEAEVGYGPRIFSVKKGTTVTFNNLDVVPHNVTFRDGSYDSGLNAPGSSISMIMSTPGTYAYFCNLHPRQMSGTITVTVDT